MDNGFRLLGARQLAEVQHSLHAAGGSFIRESSSRLSRLLPRSKLGRYIHEA